MEPTTKNPAAVALGKRGGAAKVAKGFATMSPEKAAQIRAAGLETRRKNAEARRPAK